MSASPERSCRELLLPYLLPYLLYVGAGLLREPFGAELCYAARLVLCGGALVWAWPRLAPLRGPRSPPLSTLVGVGVGLLATPLWIALLVPFAGDREAWDPAAFALRLLAASTLAPLAEELLMRGYLLRLLVLWSRERRRQESGAFTRAFEHGRPHGVEPGACTPLALAGSTLVFAAGHAPPEWPAAACYGLLMATLWILRKDLLSCVLAHAATNVALALYVGATGRWELW